MYSNRYRKCNIYSIIAVPTTVELSADKLSVTPGTTVTFTAKVKDQNQNVMSSEVADIYQGTTKLTGTTFSTATEGTYTFTAKSGTLVSGSVTVTVKAQ